MTPLQTTDGLQLHTIAWPIQDDPKAILLIVHGIGEHSGRYAHVAKALNQQGYSVYSYDHRGHGQSEGDRVYFDNFAVPVEDLRLVFTMIRAKHPGKAIYLYGHSMGSLISLLYLLKYPQDVAGFISSGSPLMVDTAFPAGLILLGRFLSRVVPRLPFAPVDPNTVSRDPAVVAAYRTDPFNNQKRMPIRIIAGLFDNARLARDQVKRITVPLLILHGEADTLTPLSGSQWLYEQAGSSDKTLKVYPGLYHEVHNEVEQTQVFTDVITWLKAR
ncbi:MAG: lysophospholipase [Anaerolineae bacterium]|jgi:alpha-beta hydrolase superfamily lysophospholipase|nr:lysophospholipase [Anaerolineae bacterium]